MKFDHPCHSELPGLLFFFLCLYRWFPWPPWWRKQDYRLNGSKRQFSRVVLVYVTNQLFFLFLFFIFSFFIITTFMMYWRLFFLSPFYLTLSRAIRVTPSSSSTSSNLPPSLHLSLFPHQTIGCSISRDKMNFK